MARWQKYGTLAPQVEKLARRWHVGAYIGTLARVQMDHADTHGTHLTPLLKETDGFLKYVKVLINY